MSNKPRKYAPELRAEVVAYVLDAGHTPAQAARDFGLVGETVRNWVKAEKKKRLGNTDEARDAGARARISELERRLRQVEEENAFLKKSGGLLRKGTAVSEKFAFILAEKANFSVLMMCRLLGVSTSGYYEWENRPVSETALWRQELAGLVEDKFVQSGATYGYRRVHAELVRDGIDVDDETVRAVMRERGLMPVQVKRRRCLTRQDASAGPIPDLVGRDFTGTAPGAKMVGDITEVTTGEGPLYLATVLDCFSKTVLGWAVDERYPASLVCAAIDAAADRIAFPDGAIFHSDRGSQYTSHEFADKLAAYGILQSAGRTGICFDNAMAESFFGKLKTEFVHHRTFATRAEARREIIKYIEGFYNRRRLHSANGYRPPFEVLEEWFTENTAA